MRHSVKSVIMGGVAALAIGAASVAAVTPAQADWHGYHGGGGWHGGHEGWHGGHDGWRGEHEGWRGGGWYGPALGIGALGLATGAIIASQPYYGYNSYYGYGAYYNGCTGYQPVYDYYGRVVGRRWVNICQ